MRNLELNKSDVEAEVRLVGVFLKYRLADVESGVQVQNVAVLLTAQVPRSAETRQQLLLVRRVFGNCSFILDRCVSGLGSTSERG